MKNWIIPALALAVGFGVTVLVGPALVDAPQEATADAQWAFVGVSADELIHHADLVVTAEHILAEPAEQLGSVPFTDNVFGILDVLRGDHDGESLIVHQTGGILPEGVMVRINDGGRYTEGRQYLLFLKAREDGSYYLINSQSRYEIVKGGGLHGLEHDDPVVQTFERMSLTEAAAAISG